MGLTGIAQTVDHSDRVVDCRIQADGIVGSGDIVVDRSGKSHRGNAVEGHIGCTAEGSVSADANERVDTVLAAGCHCLLHCLLGLELGATAGKQERAAHADHVVYGLVGKLNELALEKTRITTNNANGLDAHRICLIDHCFYASTHSGRVSARGQNADFSELFHFLSLPKYQNFII